MFPFVNKKVMGVWSSEVKCIKLMEKSEVIQKRYFENIGWYQPYAFGKLFQPFGHGILLEKIGLLFGEWKPKCWTKTFYRVSRFLLFSSACFFTYVQAEFWQSSVSAVFFFATFLSSDKPQIFGFIVMKSGPRRWLTLLCSGFFTPDERWGTEKSWVKLEQAGLE